MYMKRGVALSVATLYFFLVLRWRTAVAAAATTKNMRILQVPRIQVIIITENDISLSMKIIVWRWYEHIEEMKIFSLCSVHSFCLIW